MVSVRCAVVVVRAQIVLAQRGHRVDVRVLRPQRVPTELEEQGDDPRVHVRGVRAPLHAPEPRDQHVQRQLLVELRVDAQALAQGVEGVVNLVRVGVRERGGACDTRNSCGRCRSSRRAPGWVGQWVQSVGLSFGRDLSSRRGRGLGRGYRGGISRTSTSTRRFTTSPSSAETFSARLALKLDAMMARLLRATAF